jgi:S-formylglutathione hydrolase FrmB
MTIATVQFMSVALDRIVSYNIIIPEGRLEPYPVVLQLHGHGDDHTTWLQRTNIALSAALHPIMIVFPDGGTSYYLNLDEPGSMRKWHSERYEDFLIKDLREHVTNTFHVRPGRWAIGGNSMGGFGAIRLGCKYPELFASIWAHSGAFWNRDDMEDTVPDLDDADIFLQAERLSQTSHNVQLTFDCGIDDRLLEKSRALHTHMEKVGLPHHYIENPGAHQWEYWNEHIPTALLQHARVFKREAQTEQ